MLGSINFLVVGTRPDLAFTATMLGTYAANPNKKHAQLIHQALRYLAGSVSIGVQYPKASKGGSTNTELLNVYVDLLLGSDPNNSKSIARFIVK